MTTYLSPGVYVKEIDSGSRPIEGVGTAVAAFVGLAPTGPYNKPTLVTNWSQYTKTFGEFIDHAYLADAVFGYFLNGGGSCYVVRLGRDEELVAPAVTSVSLSLGATRYAWSVQAVNGAPPALSVEVEATPPVTDGGSDKPASTGPGGDSVTVRVKQDGAVVETFEGLAARRYKQNSVLTVVNSRSRLIHLEELTGGALAEVDCPVATIAPPSERVAAPLTPTLYVGDPAKRTGMGGLEAIDEVTMVCAPDLTALLEQGHIDLDGFKSVQKAMIDHCEAMGDRMAILDPPPGPNGSSIGLDAQEIKDWRSETANYDSRYATLYWPQIVVADPLTGRPNAIPPCGHVAGVWARNDGTRGVWKAPANEIVRGALDVQLNITKGEHDLLNPVGINCIRSFTGRGVRIYGARTLSSDPAWRYVNVRRLFNYLEKSILNNTDWVVFEPNDPDLWAQIRRTISAFLVMEWRKGALFGRTPAEAFFVKCDDETNPAEAIDLGQVTCEIGVAPVKPAEFVIFQISQQSGGVSLVTD